MTQACGMTLNQGHIFKVKVTVHTYPKSVSGRYLLTAMQYLDNISQNYCPWPKDESWPQPKVISLISRSHCTHTQNPCPGHNVSLPYWIWIIFHTTVVHGPRVCHDLELRSFLQGQSHSSHLNKILVKSIKSYCYVGSGCYLTQFVHFFDSGRISSRSASQFTHCQNMFPGHNLPRVTWNRMILH